MTVLSPTKGVCGAPALIPAELRSLVKPPLMAGERLRDFELMRDAIVSELEPVSAIEWLWTVDLVELSWEVVRYRRLKQILLHRCRGEAIEALIARIDGAGLPENLAPTVSLHARRSAAEWRSDPLAAAEIEARLERSGFDDGDVEAEAFIQAREVFMMLDHLSHSTQSRRITLLREMCHRREFAKRKGSRSTISSKRASNRAKVRQQRRIEQPHAEYTARE